MSNREPVEIDAKTGQVETLPQKPKEPRYRCKLDTLQDVKREMSRLYRESRSGLIDPAAATKLVWMLQAVGKVIEGSDLEKRIERLEQKQ